MSFDSSAAASRGACSDDEAEARTCSILRRAGMAVAVLTSACTSDDALGPARRACRGRCPRAWWHCPRPLLGSTTHRRGLAQLERQVGLDHRGCSRTTVFASSTTVPEVGEEALVLVGAAWRPRRGSNENLTVFASKASPFWNLTLRLSLKTKVFMSGDDDQLSASSGVTAAAGIDLGQRLEDVVLETSPAMAARPRAGGRVQARRFAAACRCSAMFLPRLREEERGEGGPRARVRQEGATGWRGCAIGGRSWRVRRVNISDMPPVR